MNIVVRQENKKSPLTIETDSSNHNVVAEYGIVFSKDDIDLAKQKLIQARNTIVNRNHFFFNIAMSLLFTDASRWLNTYSIDRGGNFYFNTGYILKAREIDLADFFEEELKFHALDFLAMKTVFC